VGEPEYEVSPCKSLKVSFSVTRRPVRYIEYFPCHLRRRSFAGQQVGIDGIVDVGEVPALLAVAKHRGLLPAQHQGDELCQHARVGRRRILPRTKNIEVAQRHGFQSIAR